MNTGADFVKISTGFGTAGAILDNIKLIKEIGGNKILIKVSGGIKTMKFIEADTKRIGTSSGVQIIS